MSLSSEYTPFEERTAVRLFEGGYSISYISEEMGKTRCSVWDLLALNGIDPGCERPKRGRKRMEFDMARALKMKRAGCTYKQIAQELGCSSSLVKKRFAESRMQKEAGTCEGSRDPEGETEADRRISIMGPYYTPEETEFVRTNYRDHGKKWEGWKVGLPNRSWQSIRQKAKNMGLKRRVTTREELEFLTICYPFFGQKWLGWKIYLPYWDYATISSRSVRNGINKFRRFTYIEDRALEAFLGDGKTYAQIGRTLDRTAYECEMRHKALMIDKRVRDRINERM